MKIVIITFDEPFYITNLFKPVITYHKENISAVIIVPPKSSKVKANEFIKEQMLLMDTSKFLFKGLLYIKETFMVKIGLSNKSVKRIAEKNKISVYKFSSVNDRQTKNLLTKIKPDIVLTQVPEIIQSEVLKTARIGFINKHASLLPKYRGKHPIFWALLNGEQRVGYTLHLMDENIDAGKALVQRAIEVSKNDTVSSLYEKIFSKAGFDLSNLISDIKKNKRIVFLKSINIGRRLEYYSAPAESDIKKFKTMGLKYS